MPQLPHVPPAPSPPQDLPSHPIRLVVGVGVRLLVGVNVFVGKGALVGVRLLVGVNVFVGKGALVGAIH